MSSSKEKLIIRREQTQRLNTEWNYLPYMEEGNPKETAH